MFTFVKPSIVRLFLGSDKQDWIDIRKELNKGELDNMRTSHMKAIRPTSEGRDEITVDFGTFGVRRAFAYITAWSATRPGREEGSYEPVPFTIDALRSLSEESFKAIDDALTAYIEEQEKNAKGTGSPKPDTTAA